MKRVRLAKAENYQAIHLVTQNAVPSSSMHPCAYSHRIVDTIRVAAQEKAGDSSLGPAPSLPEDPRNLL